jgi:hypothetical protein
MRIGGSDGYGEVFVFTARRNSSSGATTIAVTPRLAENESVIAIFPRTILRLRGAGAGVLATGAGGYPGKDNHGTVLFIPKLKEGTLFVTSRRLVFLRRKIDWKEAYAEFKRSVRAEVSMRDQKKVHVYYNNQRYEGIPPEMPFWRALLSGGLEYCEIPLEEIVRLDRSSTGGRIWIESHRRSYIMRLTRGQAETVALLTRGKRM